MDEVTNSLERIFEHSSMYGSEFDSFISRLSDSPECAAEAYQTVFIDDVEYMFGINPICMGLSYQMEAAKKAGVPANQVLFANYMMLISCIDYVKAYTAMNDSYQYCLIRKQ